MTDLSRRSFMGMGATALAVSTTLGQSAAAQGLPANVLTDVPVESLSTADAPFMPTKVIQTDRMDWEPGRAWQRKMLYRSETSGSHIMLLYVPPGWDGGPNHYHLFHEWAYILSGDLTNSDYTSPEHKAGFFQQFTEGEWLDRPAYSLHGGEPGRLMSQIGCFLLIQEEGEKSIGVIPSSPIYDEQYKDVKKWAMPRVIDTIRDMVWEDEGNVDGLRIKRLADDPGRGFRANLLWLPAGWSSERAPDFGRPYYYREAREFNFVLQGGMKIQTYQNTQTKAEELALGRYFYLERAPMCIFGLAEGLVTEQGCVWLQVTYSDGENSVISNNPIEDPIFL